MPRPGRGSVDQGLSSLNRDLAFLADQGIALLVTLTLESGAAELAARHGIESLHIPVADFTAPSQGQLQRFLAAAAACIERGQAVGVHCAAGKGRTGTFAAAYLVAQGADARDAIAEVRRLRPGSIETREQEAAIVALARALGGET